MFTVKNIQDRWKRREGSPAKDSNGEVVASGFLCPNCRTSFSEVEQLMQHVSLCSQQDAVQYTEPPQPIMPNRERESRRGSTQSQSSTNSSIFSTPLSNGMHPSNLNPHPQQKLDLTPDMQQQMTSSGVGSSSHYKSESVSSASSMSLSSPAQPHQETTPSAKKNVLDAAFLSQELARWKAECDEQKSLIEALNQKARSKEDLLQKKMLYIEKLEKDILTYEEKADDEMAMKNELSSLQLLVANMSSEHEKEVNDLLDKLHRSEEEKNELDVELRKKTEALSLIETQSADHGRQASSSDQDSAFSESLNAANINQHREITHTSSCQQCDHKDQLISQLTSQVNSMRSFSDSTVLALQQQVEQLQAKAAKPCEMCKEYEFQLKKEHRQHSAEIGNMQNQLISLESKAGEQKRLNEQTEAQSLSLANELQLKKSEVEKLAQDLSIVQESLGASDQEREKLKQDIVAMKSLPEKNKQLNQEIESLQAKLKDGSDRITLVEKERDDAKKQLSDCMNELETAEKNLLNCEHEKNLLQKQMTDQKENLTSQIETLRCNISAVREELAESESTSEEQMSMLNQNLAMLRSELTGKEEEVSRMESKVEQMEKQLAEKNMEMKGFKESADTLNEKLEAKNQEFDRLKTHYVEIRASLEGAQRVMFELGREQQSLQIERTRMLERNWLPDDHVDNCLGCNKEFSATLRKHHCRCCGKIFCNECSSKRAKLPAHPTPVRVCNECCELLPVSTITSATTPAAAAS